MNREKKRGKTPLCFWKLVSFFSLFLALRLAAPKGNDEWRELQKGAAGHTGPRPVSIRAAQREVCTTRRVPLSSLNKCCFTEVVTVWFNYREKEKVHSSLWTAWVGWEPEFASLQGPLLNGTFYLGFPICLKGNKAFLAVSRGGKGLLFTNWSDGQKYGKGEKRAREGLWTHNFIHLFPIRRRGGDGAK